MRRPDLMIWCREIFRGSPMRDLGRAAVATVLIALFATVYSTTRENPSAQPQIDQSPENPVKAPNTPPREPTVTVFDYREVQGILGKEVRSAADENMGRIVDVLVNRAGQLTAAIIALAASSASAVARSRSRGMHCVSRPRQSKASVFRWS